MCVEHLVIHSDNMQLPTAHNMPMPWQCEFHDTDNKMTIRNLPCMLCKHDKTYLLLLPCKRKATPLDFQISPANYHSTIAPFPHVSSRGCTIGPFAAAVPKDSASSHPNNNSPCTVTIFSIMCPPEVMGYSPLLNRALRLALSFMK
jgi:hypothetical protein